jgi:hypothetical protein
MENCIYNFGRSRCLYVGKTLNELLAKAEEYGDRDSEERFELGLYERESTKKEFFLFHGNDIIRFALHVTCKESGSTTYLDDTESFCISAVNDAIHTLVKFSDGLDDFDLLTADLESDEEEKLPEDWHFVQAR